MPTNRLIPARHIETEFTDQNSRFITNAAPAFSVEEAQAFISRIKDKYPDASHHVPVYLIGHSASTVAHCSDAGEPSGTAGRPALAVLQGSGLGDVVMVITRYFGGTKLGTGGLVRAYSDSVRLALESLPLAKKVATTTVMFVIPYHLYEQTRLLINHHVGKIKDEAFGADVTMTVMIDNDFIELFTSKMVSLTNGGIQFITIDHSDCTIMPLRH
jgi:uncharacterized YigZ family protein